MMPEEAEIIWWGKAKNITTLLKSVPASHMTAHNGVCDN